MDEDVARITQLLQAPLETAGFHLESVKATAAGARRALTVVIDLDESSTEAMSMEKIAESTRIVSDTLEEVEVFRDKPYQLEVTSPGATRALEVPRHFRRVLGRRLEIRTKKDKLTLELQEVGEAGISGIDVGSREPRTLAFNDIDHAQVELKFR